MKESSSNRITLRKVKIEQLNAVFAPALKCDSKLSFQLTANRLEYVAAAPDKGLYKHHQVDTKQFCDSIEGLSGDNVLHTFIYNGSDFKATLREFQTPVDIDFNYKINDDGRMVCDSLRVYDENMRLVISFSCADLNLGYIYKDDAAKGRLFGHINESTNFELSAAQLAKINSISNLKNSDRENSYFTIKTVDGQLIAEDVSFDYVIIPEFDIKIQDCRISKNRLGFLDNIDYLVETSYVDDVDDPYYKIIFRSKDGFLESTFALLNSVDDVTDDELESDFTDFNLSMNS